MKILQEANNFPHKNQKELAMTLVTLSGKMTFNKLAKTLSAKIGSLESIKSEKSSSLHVCHCKIFLKRRMTFPFSSAS